MPRGTVFISYAREDLNAVRKLRAGLAAAGLIVWFDFDRLDAGDDVDRKIKKNIWDSSCFLPVLSRNTESRREAYFHREWRIALDRDMNIAPDKPFLIPVIIDDTPKFSAVPDRFLEPYPTRLLGGQVAQEFVRRIQEIVAGSSVSGKAM